MAASADGIHPVDRPTANRPISASTATVRQRDICAVISTCGTHNTDDALCMCFRAAVAFLFGYALPLCTFRTPVTRPRSPGTKQFHPIALPSWRLAYTATEVEKPWGPCTPHGHQDITVYQLFRFALHQAITGFWHVCFLSSL